MGKRLARGLAAGTRDDDIALAAAFSSSSHSLSSSTPCHRIRLQLPAISCLGSCSRRLTRLIRPSISLSCSTHNHLRTCKILLPSRTSLSSFSCDHHCRIPLRLANFRTSASMSSISALLNVRRGRNKLTVETRKSGD
ncbi:hypothetical protein BDN72DRAFT_685492 [Pluteus cervinus]|uniref:Uncharacterized protein n=1 Tax=Pluteus cervinus TaxID=181527 RepID=A0ACD3AST9_9AGAR|nr:hypothetical protein BDN72DRAFT_685492 [Pluteus cervinus]